MIDPFITTVGALAATTLLWGRVRRARRLRSWKRAAEAAGLTQVEVRTDGHVTGQADGLKVCLEESELDGKKATRIVVSGLRHHPLDLTFRRESMGAAIERGVLGQGQGEIEIGDPVFDETVSLRGSRELAFALFNAETRAQVLRLMEGEFESPFLARVSHDPRVSLLDGELRADLPEKGGWYAAPAALPVLLAIASRLRAPSDLAPQVAHNALHDPQPRVRLRNLAALAEAFPKHAQTPPALRAALMDSDEGIRLRAAIALGVEGWDTLLELASSARAEAHAANAIQALGQHLPAERAREIYQEARRDRRMATARACLESLEGREDPEVVELLVQALGTGEPDLAAAAARALGSIPSPAVEAHLIDALPGSPPGVLVAVAQELGRLGTVVAVMPLRSALERVPDGGFRRAAREAIAAIQARVQGGAPGQVSLAAAGAGQVSLAEEDTRGRLSEADSGDEVT